MRQDFQTANTLSVASTQMGWTFIPAAAVDSFGFGLVETGQDPMDFSGGAIRIGQPLLYGPGTKQLLLQGKDIEQSGEVTLFHSGSMVSGFAQVPVTADTLEAATYDVYRNLIEGVGAHAFCRFWNYVPDINHVSGSHIENYQRL